jgi:hypothetical protein
MMRSTSQPISGKGGALVHLDQRDLAKRWRISPRTLERWRWAGRGPRFLKVGGRCLYRLQDVEAFEADRLRSVTASRAKIRQGRR